MEGNIELPRFICLLVGYAFGCFLTADVVARARLGKPATQVGSHNPGMANIAGLLGVKWAAVTLVGDLAKTFAACLLCRWLLAPELSTLIILYAGIGTALGHNYPVWNRFVGGKGVAVTCAAIFLFDPVWALVSMAAGLAVVLASRQLCYGAVVIVAVFCAAQGFICGPGEVLILCAVLLVLMVLKHGGPCWRALHGEEHQIDVLAHLKRGR